jgi:hypothetical protein
MTEATLDKIPKQLSDAKPDFESSLTPHYSIPGLLLQLVGSAGLAKESTLVIVFDSCDKS